MANSIKGEVEIEVPEGPTFTIAFSWEALSQAEDKRGKGFTEIVEELDAGRLGSLIALLWAGLRKHHPSISFEEAGNIALACDSDELKAKIVEAITKAFPRKKEGGAAGARPPQEAAST